MTGREQIWRIVGGQVDVFRFDILGTGDFRLGAIALSPEGTVWVGGLASTAPLLLRHERGVWTAFGPDDGLPYLGMILHLDTDSSGTIWAGIEMEGVLPLGEGLKEPVPSLVSFDGERWTAYHLGNVVPPRTTPEDLLVDRSGHVWMASDGRVVHKDGPDFLVYEWETAPWDGGWTLAADSESGVWIGGFGGPFGRLLDGRWYELGGTGAEELPLLVQGRVIAIHSTGAGRAWVWDEGGTLSRVTAQWATGVLEMPDAGAGSSGFFELGPSFPNPFNASTTLVFSMPQQEEVSLRVYSASGQLVDAWIEGSLGPGLQRAQWHGHDMRGQPVASGVYVLVLTAGNLTRARSVTVLK